MFVPLLILFIPVFLSPLWSFFIYDFEIKHQEEQILLDNTAILAGRKERDILNELKKRSLKLHQLHFRYHEALACSLVPSTGQICRVLAQQISDSLKYLVAEIETTWHLKWNQSSALIFGELSKKGKNIKINRSPSVSMKWKVCTLCQRPLSWNLDQKSLVSELQSQSYPEVKIKVSAQLKELQWSYRIWSDS